MADKSSSFAKQNARELFLTILRNIVWGEDSFAGVKKYLDHGVDWDYLLPLASHSRAVNLLYLGLKKYLPCIPSEAVLWLKGHSLRTENKNQRDLLKIKKALSDFAGAGIKVISVKGLLLSRMLYSDMNYRGIVNDLDVLVEESSQGSAEALLRENGYNVEGETEPAEFQWQKETVIKGDVFGVDLHWNLSRHWQDKRALEEMFRDARQECLEDIPYLNLSLEDELIYLSVHLAVGNGYRSLLYVADIARFIHIFRDKIDAEKLLDKALRFHLTSSLYYGLLLAKRFFDCGFSDGLMLKIKPPPLKRLLIYPFVRRKNFFAQTFTNKLVKNYLSFFLFDLVEARGFKDYARIARIMLFPRGKETRLSVGRFARIILVPVRWLGSEIFRRYHEIRIKKIVG